MIIFSMINSLWKLCLTLMLSNYFICVTGLSPTDSTHLLSNKDILCIKKYVCLLKMYLHRNGYQLIHDSWKNSSSSYSVKSSPTEIHNFQVHRVATVLKTDCSCRMGHVVDSYGRTISVCRHVCHVRCAWHIKEGILRSNVSMS